MSEPIFSLNDLQILAAIGLIMTLCFCWIAYLIGKSHGE